MALLFSWGLSSKAPKPLWIVYVPDASRTNPPTTHAYIQPENGSLFKLARCTFVPQMDLAAMPEKRFLAFSKINDCPTIESCPIAPKSPGEPQKTFATTGRKGKLTTCRQASGRFCIAKTLTCCLSADCFICV
jgi:hypothetical protein